MADIQSFRCVRPNREIVDRVAALPYDVYNRAEATEVVKKDPITFLAIDRAETTLPDDVDTYAPEVYEHAKGLYQERLSDGTFIRDDEAAYYVYELVMDGRSQTGLVAVAAIDDYINGVIKKHENTRADKEIDRITHVDTLGAQTGPIFLAYRDDERVTDIINKAKTSEPLYDFTADDGIAHRVWKISDMASVDGIHLAFSDISKIYIADGHHRAASAVKVGIKRRDEGRTQTTGEGGRVESDYFLSVLFPQSELKIFDYNRTVKDLNGLDSDEFIEKIKEGFSVEKSDSQVRPEKKGQFGMYLDGQWYLLTADDRLYSDKDAVGALDASVLQDNILGPVLGIADPRTDSRIDFIGGIRGLSELEKRADSDMKVSFSMYPTSMDELFSVADAGLLMPPKSTWFEPKLRSGLFIHEID